MKSLQKSERNTSLWYITTTRYSCRSVALRLRVLYTNTVPLYITSLGRTTTSDAPARMTDEYTMVSSSTRAAQPSRGGALTVR